MRCNTSASFSSSAVLACLLYTSNGDYFADFYELDPQKGWKQISDIYYPRYGAIAFVANNLGYVCFGGLYSSTSKQNVQVYDPVAARCV